MNKALLVLLHGYGSDPTAMGAIGQQLASIVPGLTVLTPHGDSAPGGGYRWFPISSASEDEIDRGARAAAPRLHRYLDEQKQRLGLREDQIVLGGFSQGAILALHVGLRRPEPPGAILAYAGFLSGRDRLADITCRPPVTIVHGQKDPIVPVAAHHLSVQALQSAGVPVTSHVSPQTGHSVDATGLSLAVQTLLGVLKSRV
jgi:phospholipase/carboxylesterase